MSTKGAQQNVVVKVLYLTEYKFIQVPHQLFKPKYEIGLVSSRGPLTFLVAPLTISCFKGSNTAFSPLILNPPEIKGLLREEYRIEKEQ